MKQEVKSLEGIKKEDLKEWQKYVIMYKVDGGLFLLFLQVIVDFLKNEHKNKDVIHYENIYEIDYDNNTISDRIKKINLSEVDLKDERISEKLKFTDRLRLKSIRSFIETVHIKDLYNRLKRNFGVYAKYGFLRVEYSILTNKVAIIIYSRNEKLKRIMQDNMRKVKKYNRLGINISLYSKSLSYEDIIQEFKEYGVLKEVEDIIVITP